MLRIQRLRARALLDNPAPTLGYAEAEAAAGDPSWDQWLDDYKDGRAFIVRLEVALEAWDGDRHLIERTNRGIFVEAHPHPPKVERQIAEAAGKDFTALANELRRRGLNCDPDELHDMYVHVDLGAGLRDALADAAERNGVPGDHTPELDVGLSVPDQRD